jgi:hypothetical protein
MKTEAQIKAAILKAAKPLDASWALTLNDELNKLFNQKLTKLERGTAFRAVMRFLENSSSKEIAQMLLDVGFFEPARYPAIWDMDLIDTGIGQRVVTVLNNHQIFYVGELVSRTVDELKFPGFGVAGKLIINNFLSANKLKLGADTTGWISPDPTRSY